MISDGKRQTHGHCGYFNKTTLQSRIRTLHTGPHGRQVEDAEHVRVEPARRQQLQVLALLQHTSAVHHTDAVAVFEVLCNRKMLSVKSSKYRL